MPKLYLDSTIPLPSGAEIPHLGFGVYEIAPGQTKNVVLEALSAGYRHIDTAQAYDNEADVGQAIKEAGIPRHQIFVTTKIPTEDYKGNAKELIEGSLKTLGLDYVDLFLIHEPIAGKKIRLEIWRALIEAKRAGKIRDIGVSNFNVNHFEEIKAAGLELPAVNQVELHPLDQQRPIVEYCQKNKIIMEAYSPLIRARFDIPTLQDLVKKHKKSPAQVLVRWSLQKGFIPLPRSSNPGRIRENTDVYDFELSPADIRALDALDKGDAGAITWNPIHYP